jgi:ParB-like chromosome segregation protein Spo0J
MVAVSGGENDHPPEDPESGKGIQKRGGQSMKTELIPISLIFHNNGQIEGVPKNPRIIDEDDFATLVESIRATPEMMDLRELIVYPTYGGAFVAIAGNMRLDACHQLKWEQVPCKILPADTPTSKLREIAIKDNNHFGRYDREALMEWDPIELEAWGMEMDPIPEMEAEEETEEPVAHDRMKHQKEIRLRYTESEYLIIKEMLSKHAETPELAVKKLLGIDA